MSAMFGHGASEFDVLLVNLWQCYGNRQFKIPPECDGACVSSS